MSMVISSIMTIMGFMHRDALLYAFLPIQKPNQKLAIILMSRYKRIQYDTFRTVSFMLTIDHNTTNLSLCTTYLVSHHLLLFLVLQKNLTHDGHFLYVFFRCQSRY